MKKIPTLFLRKNQYLGHTYKEADCHQVVDVVSPGCEWVLEDKGVATRKWDGTCCLVKDGKLFKRHTFHANETVFEISGPRYIYCETDHRNRKIVWLPITDSPEDKWHNEALANWLGYESSEWPSEGTYELCGPKVNGNHEGLDHHVLVKHGDSVHGLSQEDTPGWNTFDQLRILLLNLRQEGIVWHHRNDPERRAKIKRRDFGLEWPIK